ncbi:MAG: hypothetical protein JF607_21690 [Burkholderiales bacterium]|nr:hypothetical protein [Burkholderiales bacterium]MBW8893176.1 hypothetical protein [Burkholderiales bacterium]
MKLLHMRTTGAVAIVTIAPLASQTQSGDGRADWPGVPVASPTGICIKAAS